jgi:hypothetical protein
MGSRLLFAALVVVALISAGLAAVLVHASDDAHDPMPAVGAATAGWHLAGRTTTAPSGRVRLDRRPPPAGDGSF